MNGNFLEYAGSKLGVDVGYGKMILVYGAKTSMGVSDLSAININENIVDGIIVGIIKGWHTIAGAPVGEISVERTGTSEIKLIRPEVLADVLTFESNLSSSAVLADLVKAGSFNCILIDDQGNCFGDYSQTAGQISTMLINFSTKTTSSFQHDNSTEKTVSVTARYLVEDLSFVDAGTETEMVISKTLLVGQLVSAVLLVAGKINLSLKDKETGEPFIEMIDDMNIDIKGTDVVATGAVNTAGVLAITFEAPIVAGSYQIAISGGTFYMKETTFIIA